MKSEKIGLWISIGCMIHCIFVALIPPFFEIIGIGHFAHGWIEALFWVLILPVLYSGIRKGTIFYKLLFSTIGILGSLSLIFHWHTILFTCFISIALINTYILFFKKEVCCSVHKNYTPAPQTKIS